LGSELLHPGDYVVCCDEKPSIQARHPKHATLPAAAAVKRGQRVEHEYERKGALCYLAAWDARRAKLFDRCAAKDGIVPFDALVEQFMTVAPYSKAQRVFVIVDNGSAHRAKRSIDRLQGAWPNLILVHTPTTPAGSTKPRSTSPSSNAKPSPPTTSPNSTRSSARCSSSAAATSRSPPRSNGSSPAPTSTASTTNSNNPPSPQPDPPIRRRTSEPQH
jgi:hypothetical protein